MVSGKLTVLTVSPIAEKDNDIWTPTIAQIVDIDEKPLEDPLILSPIPGPEIMFKTPPFLTPEKTFNIAVSIDTKSISHPKYQALFFVVGFWLRQSW